MFNAAGISGKTALACAHCWFLVSSGLTSAVDKWTENYKNGSGNLGFCWSTTEIVAKLLWSLRWICPWARVSACWTSTVESRSRCSMLAYAHCWFLVSSCLFALVCKALAQRGLACKKAGARCCCRCDCHSLPFTRHIFGSCWMNPAMNPFEGLLGTFLHMILDWTSIFLREAFFWQLLQYHCHWSRPPGLVFWMGLGAFYSTELLQHRFLMVFGYVFWTMSGSYEPCTSAEACLSQSQPFAPNQVPSADLFHFYVQYVSTISYRILQQIPSEKR